MAERETQLSDAVFAQLQNEKFVMLHTIDADSEGPTSSAISWVYAVDSNTLRFSVDQRSRIVANIRKSPQVAVTVFASGTVHEIIGKTTIVSDALEDVPFKLTCMDIAVESTRDAMFYGARISTEPEYEKTYDKRAAEKLDNQVFSAMKKA
jgi:hypothetical protein